MGLGSGIRDPGPENTYSGSRGQKGTGSRIRNTEKLSCTLIVKMPFMKFFLMKRKNNTLKLFAQVEDPQDYNQCG